MTVSLAKRPVIAAIVAFQFPKPSGWKKKAKPWPIEARIL